MEIEWWKQAACLGAPTRFFYRFDGQGEHEFDEAPGKGICRECTVFKACFIERMEKETFGLWAHVAEHEVRLFVYADAANRDQEELRQFVVSKTAPNSNRRRRGQPRRKKQDHDEQQRPSLGTGELGGNSPRGEPEPECLGEGGGGSGPGEGVRVPAA